MSDHIAKALPVGRDGHKYEPYYVDWIRNPIDDAKEASEESSSHVHCCAATFVYYLDMRKPFSNSLAGGAFEIGEVEDEQYYVDEDEGPDEEPKTGKS